MSSVSGLHESMRTAFERAAMCGISRGEKNKQFDITYIIGLFGHDFGFASFQRFVHSHSINTDVAIAQLH